jgi:hypothetical protein
VAAIPRNLQFSVLARLASSQPPQPKRTQKLHLPFKGCQMIVRM